MSDVLPHMAATIRIEEGRCYVGDRLIPNAKPNPPDFKPLQGFHVMFENGWTLSVQFGYGNYCDNRWVEGAGFPLAQQSQTCVPSTTAELALWDHADRWATFPDGDTVAGWVTVEQLSAFIDQIAAWPSGVERAVLRALPS